MKKSLIIGMAAGIALSCFVGCNHNLIITEEPYVIENESESTETEKSENESARYGKGRGYGNGNSRNGGGGTSNTSSFS